MNKIPPVGFYPLNWLNKIIQIKTFTDNGEKTVKTITSENNDHVHDILTDPEVKLEIEKAKRGIVE